MIFNKGILFDMREVWIKVKCFLYLGLLEYLIRVWRLCFLNKI